MPPVVKVVAVVFFGESVLVTLATTGAFCPILSTLMVGGTWVAPVVTGLVTYCVFGVLILFTAFTVFCGANWVRPF